MGTDVSKSVMAGSMWGHPTPGAEAGFLGGFVEDMGGRNVSEIAISGAWADCSMVAEAIENLPTQGAVCVLVHGRDAKDVRVRLACQSQRGELGLPTNQAPAPGS